MKCIDAGGDYVRDVSIPCGWESRAAAWKAPVLADSSTAGEFTSRELIGKTASGYQRNFNEPEYRGDNDGL